MYLGKRAEHKCINEQTVWCIGRNFASAVLPPVIPTLWNTNEHQKGKQAS